MSSQRYDTDERLVAAFVLGHQLTYGFGPAGGCPVSGGGTTAGANTNRTSLVDLATVGPRFGTATASVTTACC